MKDIDAIYRDLTEKGFTFTRPPFKYQPDWMRHAVKEVVLVGPDNVTCGHFQIITPKGIDAPGNYIRFDHCAQTMDNLSEGIKFYRDILGLDLGWEITLAEGLLDELLETPPGTEVKTAFFERRAENALGIQTFQFSVKGKPTVARPPNLGLLMMSFEVDNLSSLIKTFKQERIPILSGPVELHTKVHGKMRAIIVEGPGGTMVELFER